jgi:hypothetical protein
MPGDIVTLITTFTYKSSNLFSLSHIQDLLKHPDALRRKMPIYCFW